MGEMMGSLPTLKDIAAHSGVSYRTVLEVMSNRPSGQKYYYSPGARDTVLATAQQLGYRKNRTASNIVHRRHGTLALVVGSLFSIPTIMLNAMSKAAAAHDLLIVIDRIDQESPNPRCVSEDMADGAIVAGGDVAEIGRRLQKLSVPTVFLNTGRQRGPGVIAYNEKQGMESLVHAAASRSRRRCAFYGEPNVHPAGRIRRETLARASAEAGMAEPVFVSHERSRYSADFFEAHLDENPDIDTLIVAERNVIQAYNAAAMLGRCIGDDLSVLCYYELSRIGMSLMPRACGVRVHYYNTGVFAVESMVNLIDGTPVPARTVPYDWVEGESL